MDKQRKWTIRRLILMVAAFVFGVALAFGQNGNGNNGNSNNGNDNHGKDDGNSKVAGCPSDQKNCTKLDKRWQGAINNRDRHAADVRKNDGKDKGGHH